VLAIRADVGNEADVKAAVDTAVEQFGRLDIMVPSISSIAILVMLNE
jgi:NAD(P)-dependent dehydrogenase (short-subunit alcohol dehydrogenase family)